MKAYLVYKYEWRDADVKVLKVFKNKEDAEKFCQEQPHEKGVTFHFDELEAEGF